MEPLSTPRTMSAPSHIVPEASIKPTVSVRTALPNWLPMIRYFLGILSESAPPRSETIAIGAANDTIAQVSADGESFSRRSTSQPRVIICMFIAVNDANEPSQIHRKSASSKISTIGDCFNFAVNGTGVVGATVAGAFNVLCAKSDPQLWRHVCRAQCHHMLSQQKIALCSLSVNCFGCPAASQLRGLGMRFAALRVMAFAILRSSRAL